MVKPAVGKPLRKESLMATLKKRRGNWYARVQWRNTNYKMREIQIPLRTESKAIAISRLFMVDKVETDIKAGISFTFPWLNDTGHLKVLQFTLEEAIDKWMYRRKKSQIRRKTLELNELGLKYFSELLGTKRVLNSIGNADIDKFIYFLESKGMAKSSINMHLRTVKSMMRYYRKIGKLNSIPVIDQCKVVRIDPIYITDDEFQSIISLDWLDRFYKLVFVFYRETGLRLREPFISILNGRWLDISTDSKTHSARSIELSGNNQQIFNEIQNWYFHGYGSTLQNCGDHFSKIFKKALRCINADEGKRFHSLRHTFAVRRLLMKTPVYDVKLMMGHASVTTTEQYTRMNLKRVAQDFPTLVSHYAETHDSGQKDTYLKDTADKNNVYLPLLKQIEG